jgi:hypothetical protein
MLLLIVRDTISFYIYISFFSFTFFLLSLKSNNLKIILLSTYFLSSFFPLTFFLFTFFPLTFLPHPNTPVVLNADSLHKMKLIKYGKYITNLTSLTIKQYFNLRSSSDCDVVLRSHQYDRYFIG